MPLTPFERQTVPRIVMPPPFAKRRGLSIATEGDIL